MYISSHWFAGRTLALLMGVGNSIGMMGAVFGQGPLSLMVKAISWRPTMFILGAAGLVLSFIIFLAIRNEPASMEKHSPQVSKKTPLLHHLKIVTCNPQTWINGVVSLCFYTATVAYGGLWAIPFLVNAHGLSTTTASFAASMIYFGTVIAGPFLGHISDKTCNRKSWVIITSFLSIVIFLIINYTLFLPTAMVFVLMLLLGIMLTGQLLTYTLSVELNPREAKGTALAFTNFLVFVGGSIIQTLVGWLLQFNWSGQMSNGTPIYAPSDYQSALLCFPIAIGIAFIFAFFIKEKKKPWCTHFSSQEMHFLKKLFHIVTPRQSNPSNSITK
ncbi:MFS transporter [Simkania sp.]|uniref:MFS transporter n=1 Tax=Simkania sp. TaxID=34094 RepID=UPI003B52F3A7